MPNLPDVPLHGLYGDLILDHYRNPRNRRPVEDADVEAEEYNPFCGDRINLQLKVDGGGRIMDASAQSEGCSIIQASASMMAQLAVGKTLPELEGLSERFRNMMQGRQPAEEMADELGDLMSLHVVRQYPVRIKCALLPWTALEVGIEGYRTRTP